MGHTQCAPLGGDGGNPRQSPENAGDLEPEADQAQAAEPAPAGANMSDHPEDDATNCTPSGVPARKARQSRAKRTSGAMVNFLGQWFFDWMSATVPNGVDGKGAKRRAAPDKPDHAEDRAGRDEEAAATLELTRFAVANGLHRRRIGNVRDGYGGGIFFAASPVEGDPFVVIRTGHSTVMPAIDISGGDGRCAVLAPLALRELGPLNISRADVSHDHSAEGYFDALVAYAEADTSRPSRLRIIDDGAGRTMQWGKRSDEAMVTVYEKDLERVADGKLAADQADPHLVRVEIRINPPSANKAAMGKLATERGPGALLGAIAWVRRFVEHVAVLTGNAKTADARMAISRLNRLPVPRSCETRAHEMLMGGVKHLCNAAASIIVRQRHGGDWLAAEIDPAEVRAVAIRMVRRYIDETDDHRKVVTRLGLDRARSIDEEAARLQVDLGRWMRWQEEARVLAENHLDAAYERQRMRQKPLNILSAAYARACSDLAACDLDHAA